MARYTTGFFSGLRRIRLVLCFEQIWKTTSVEEDDFSYPVGLESAVGHETNVLFTALVLYRRAFAADLLTEFGPSSTLLSPPPSSTPTRSVKYAQILPELRKALGNRVFENNNTDVENEGEVVDMEGSGYGAPSRVLGLEVVDMIVNAERREEHLNQHMQTRF